MLAKLQKQSSSVMGTHVNATYAALTGEMLQERDTVDKQTRDAVKLS